MSFILILVGLYILFPIIAVLLQYVCIALFDNN